MCIAELADQCIREITGYHSGAIHCENYCEEMFTRAILQEDQDAWQMMQQCLRETMQELLDSHPKKEAACRLDSEENYIAQAFARFYQAAVLREVELSQLHSVMLYLSMSLNGAILDRLRASSKPGTPCGLDTSTRAREVWELLESTPLDDREQRIAYLLFNCGLGPKDIVRTFPEEFNDVREISLLRCTIIEHILQV